MIRLKRVYENPSTDDGLRVLVERLWPRGMTKEAVHIDLWMKEIAPSADLRKWYAHDLAKWEEFSRRYEAELAENSSLVETLAQKSRDATVTFVFAAHDPLHNSALILKRVVEEKLRGG